jgi:hypothetical protein
MNEDGSGTWRLGCRLVKGRLLSTPGQSGCSLSGSKVPQNTEYTPPGTSPKSFSSTVVERDSLR